MAPILFHCPPSQVENRCESFNPEYKNDQLEWLNELEEEDETGNRFDPTIEVGLGQLPSRMP